MLLEKNTDYVNLIGFGHRQEFGQFFTPPHIAKFMFDWIFKNNVNKVFDPAFGLGSFYDTVQQLDPTIKFLGFEVDSQIINFYKSNEGNYSNLTILNEDYLSNWNLRHQAIICNPPYMRFQKFINREKVLTEISKRLDEKISGYINIASAFLLKSIYELDEGGRLAYIMPLEFLNTGYGELVKKILLGNGLLKHLIKIENEKEVFPDAITTVGILLLSKDRKIEPVCFHTVNNTYTLDNFFAQKPAKVFSRNQLDPKEKWLSFFKENLFELNNSYLVPASFYGTFTRGIATGANDYFSLNKDIAYKLGLPKSSLLTCITKSTQVKNNHLTDEIVSVLENKNEKVFVFNVNGKLTDEVKSYIRFGEQNHYHERYLTKHRSPWYKLEQREPSPILFGVFSRDKFKVIRNLSSAINLTCFHCFYPNLYGSNYIDLLFLYYQSNVARKILSLSCRTYGDKLDKFEPNDLNKSLVPNQEFLNSISKESIKEYLENCFVNSKIPDELEKKFQTLLS